MRDDSLQFYAIALGVALVWLICEVAIYSLAPDQHAVGAAAAYAQPAKAEAVQWR